MTSRDFAWALVAVCALSLAVSWGVSCASLSVAREAVRWRR